MDLIIAILYRGVDEPDNTWYGLWYVLLCVKWNRKAYFYNYLSTNTAADLGQDIGEFSEFKSGLTSTSLVTKTVSIHYLQQCWPIISMVQWHPSACNFTEDTSLITNISLIIIHLQLHSNLPGANKAHAVVMSKSEYHSTTIKIVRGTSNLMNIFVLVSSIYN